VAAENAGETCPIPYDQLARLIVGGLDGLILQYVCAPDPGRARADLDLLITMLIGLVRPA